MTDKRSESNRECTTIQQSADAQGLAILQLLDRCLHGDAFRLQTLHLRAQLVGKDRHVRQLELRKKEQSSERQR